MPPCPHTPEKPDMHPPFIKEVTVYKLLCKSWHPFVRCAIDIFVRQTNSWRSEWLSDWARVTQQSQGSIWVYPPALKNPEEGKGSNQPLSLPCFMWPSFLFWGEASYFRKTKREAKQIDIWESEKEPCSGQDDRSPKVFLFLPPGLPLVAQKQGGEQTNSSSARVS